MKLLVSDYDNTYELHHTFKNLEQIFNENKKAIKKFMSEKNIFALATGRHFDAIKETIDEKNIEFNYLCCNNGAEIYDSNYRLLYVKQFSLKDLKFLKTLEDKYEIFYRTTYDKKYITSVNIYIYDEQDFLDIKNILKKELKNSYMEFKYPKIKLVNKLCNKTKIVEFILEKEIIESKDVFVIGDDLNDLEIIKKYNGFSLNSALKEVKDVAYKTYDTLSCLVNEIIDK